MNGTSSLALIIISAIVFFLFGKPMLNDISLIRQEKSAYEQAVSDVKNIESKKNELTAKLQSIPAEDRSKIEIVIPDRANIVSLVSDIDGVASRYGIAIGKIETNAVSDTSQSIEAAAPAKSYKSMYLSFDFSSNYDNLKLFLADMEKSLRLMDIRQIDVSKTEAGAFNYKLSAEIYWFE